MNRRLAKASLTLCLLALLRYGSAQDPVEPSLRYLPMDAPAGMSQAVIVDGLPLVHTRQLLPIDRDGQIVGEGSNNQQAAQQIE